MILNFSQEIKQKLDQSRDAKFKSNIYSKDLEQKEFRDGEFEDIKWLLGAIVFVFLYHMVFMRSIVLATYSILLIIFAFAVTQMFYIGVFKIDYFSPMHNLIIIMMLGICSNNTFIMFDAWQQSEQIIEYEGNTRRRMAYTFKRVSKALVSSSVITALVFFGNALCNLQPKKVFCLYAGIVILAHFVIVIIMFPPIIVIHEKYLIKNSCCQRKQKNVYSVDSIARSETCLEKFFGGNFSSIVRHLRYFLVLLFLGWTIFACYFSRNLGPKIT